MKPLSLCALLGLAAALLSPLSAQTYTFDTSSDFTSNFTVTANSSSLSWNSGGYLQEYNATTTTASLAVLGTAVSSPGFTLSADASFTYNLGSYAGASVGFLTNVTGTTATDTGYLSVFRITTTGADLRIFEGAQMNGTLPGSPLTTLTLTGSFSPSTYYTFSLAETNTGSAITFTGSILNAGTGATIGTFSSYTDTTPTNTGADLVGLRLGVVNATYTNLDNLTVSAIPEPATYALLSGAALLAFAFWRRRTASRP